MDSIRKKLLLCLVFCAMLGTITAYGKKPILLTQSMLDKAKGSFVIKQDYTASGAILYLPEQLKLVFDGGKIDHAELMGNHSTLQVKGKKPVFGKDIRISGVWDVEEVHDGWFEFEKGRDFISNQIINNMLAFSNDSTFCHLFFEEKRVYYFELPYKGKVKIGEKIGYHMENGEKKRHYNDMYYDSYAFLRIFTIPSNTKVTLNNTLQMLPTNQGAYFVFWEWGKENVTIEGTGTIAGDNKEHLYTLPFIGKKYFGEWGHLFRCFKCRNFVFRGITVRDAFGDCIIYQGSHLKYDNENRPRYADGLLIENVSIIGARRNGIAVGARNVIIRNCHFEGCGNEAAKGTPPCAAIDFEADGLRSYHEIGNRNVLMENCTFKSNCHDVSSCLNCWWDYGKTATTIRNCVFTNPLRLKYTYWIRFENCYIPQLYIKDIDYSGMLDCKYLVFENCKFGQWKGVIPAKKTKDKNSFLNCKFNKKRKISRMSIFKRLNERFKLK